MSFGRCRMIVRLTRGRWKGSVRKGISSDFAASGRLGLPTVRGRCAIVLLLALVAGILYPILDRAHGEVRNYWVEYKEGPYLDRLKNLFRGYNINLSHVAHLHVPGFPAGGMSDVEIFQVSAGESCSDQKCYYALFSANFGEIPILTGCEFELADLAHTHRPDGALVFAFQFACSDTLTQIQISRDHFWVTSTPKPNK
jgi:hypothetical protein